MTAGRILATDMAGHAEEIARWEGRPAGLGWLPDGRLLAVSMLDCRLMCLDKENWRELADLSSWCGGHANDMVVDSEGRAYVGNIGFDLEAEPFEPRPTVLLCIAPDGQVQVAAEELIAPNGMALSPSGKQLILAESGAYRLLSYDIAADGSLSNRRVFAELPEGAAPDGICLDAEGAVWAASPTSGEFLRLAEGGDVLQRISCPGRAPVAVALGGEQGRTLFCLSAPRMSMRESAMLSDARIETVQVESPGAGLPC